MSKTWCSGCGGWYYDMEYHNLTSERCRVNNQVVQRQKAGWIECSAESGISQFWQHYGVHSCSRQVEPITSYSKLAVWFPPWYVSLWLSAKEEGKTISSLVADHDHFFRMVERVANDPRKKELLNTQMRLTGVEGVGAHADFEYRDVVHYKHERYA